MTGERLNLEAEAPGERALASYLAAVRQALTARTPRPAGVEQILEHLEEQARAEAQARPGGLAVAVAALDPPSAFLGEDQEYAEVFGVGDRPGAVSEAFAAPTSERILGWASAVGAIGALVVSQALSHAQPFDTPVAGLAFLFGEPAAMAAGLIAWRTPPGKFGAIAALGMLGAFGAIWLAQNLSGAA